MGEFVVDFYCPIAKLAIEVDDDSHFTKEKMRLDSIRQKYIESFNIRFLRFTNKDVTSNLDGVLNKITEELTTPNPSLKRRGEKILGL